MKFNYKALIREFEESLQYLDCLHPTASEDAQELQDRLAEFKTMQFYARYGDTFAAICNCLRVTAQRTKFAGWETLQGSYWSVLNEKLKMESKAFQRVKTTGETEDCPASLTISWTCCCTGIEPNEVIGAIDRYANGNELLHLDLDDLVRDGRWLVLAERLVKDWVELFAAIPPNTTMPLTLLEHIIDMHIEMLLIESPLDPDEICRWKPTQYAEEESEKLLKSAQEKGRIAERAVKKVIKKLRANQ